MSNIHHGKLQYICRTCFRPDCPTLTSPSHENYVEEMPYSFPVRGTRLTAAGEDCLRYTRRMREEYPLVSRCGGQDACKCSEAGSMLETEKNASERLPAIVPFYYERKLERVPCKHGDTIVFTGTYESFLDVGNWMRRRGISGIELSFGMRGDCWFLRDQLFPGTRIVYLSPGVFRVVPSQQASALH